MTRLNFIKGGAGKTASPLSPYQQLPIFGAIFVLVLIYLLNISRGIGFIDSGELSAVCYKLGIAHPTGYPSFCIIGHLFSLIPFVERIIFRLNLMCAFLNLLSICAFYAILKHLTSTRQMQSPGLSATLVFLCLTVFGSAYFMIEAAEELEVHALQGFLTILSVLSCFKAINFDSKFDIRSCKWLYMTFFIFGLAATNHGTSIILIPGFVYILIKLREELKIRVLMISFMSLILSISTLLYLPLRSRPESVLIWGDPSNWQRFTKHISGWQFKVWLFESWDAFTVNILEFSITSFKFSFIPILFLIYFIFKVKRTHSYFAHLLLLWVVLPILYVSNYNIHDLSSYYLFPNIMIYLYACLGILFYHSTHSRIRLAIISMLVMQCAYNIHHAYKMTRRNINASEDYTKQVLSIMEPGSMLLTRQWDVLASPFLYLQIVEQNRPDIIVIDRELLRRSWYFKQLQLMYPGLLDNTEAETQSFLLQLSLFEKDPELTPIGIQTEFERLIHSILQRHIGTKYLTADVLDMPNCFRGMKLAPRGLLISVDRQTLNLDEPLKAKRFQPPFLGAIRKEKVSKMLLESIYKPSSLHYAKFLMQTGHYSESASWRELAENIK